MDNATICWLLIALTLAVLIGTRRLIHAMRRPIAPTQPDEHATLHDTSVPFWDRID
jgi:hypothetical protein